MPLVLHPPSAPTLMYLWALLLKCLLPSPKATFLFETLSLFFFQNASILECIKTQFTIHILSKVILNKNNLILSLFYLKTLQLLTNVNKIIFTYHGFQILLKRPFKSTPSSFPHNPISAFFRPQLKYHLLMTCLKKWIKIKEWNYIKLNSSMQQRK